MAMDLDDERVEMAHSMHIGMCMCRLACFMLHLPSAVAQFAAALLRLSFAAMANAAVIAGALLAHAVILPGGHGLGFRSEADLLACANVVGCQTAPAKPAMMNHRRQARESVNAIALAFDRSAGFLVADLQSVLRDCGIVLPPPTWSYMERSVEQRLVGRRGPEPVSAPVPASSTSGRKRPPSATAVADSGGDVGQSSAPNREATRSQAVGGRSGLAGELEEDRNEPANAKRTPRGAGGGARLRAASTICTGV